MAMVATLKLYDFLITTTVSLEFGIVTMANSWPTTGLWPQLDYSLRGSGDVSSKRIPKAPADIGLSNIIELGS